MPYRNKTYVCFDGDKDIHYYYLMKAWKASDKVEFDFYDAHELNSARDSSQEESIKRQLSIRLNSAKLFVVLVGESTKYLTKFVRWEMDQALSKDIPIVIVNLNQVTGVDNANCPPILIDKLCLHIPFKQKALEWAIDNWGDNFAALKMAKREPRVLSENVLRQLGL